MSSTVLALDIGDKRIGIASASAIARLPSPYGVIERAEGDDAVGRIAEIVRELDADPVIVGLPRDMKGEETGQTAKVREFAKELESRLEAALVMQDEAVTSVEAEKRLKSRGRPYTKGDIDAEAAAMILEDYLNGIHGRTA